MNRCDIPGTFQYQAVSLQVFKRIADILKNYNFDEEKGIVSDLGKHEGNTIATVYFDELTNSGYMNGDILVYSKLSYNNCYEEVYTTSVVERSILGALPGCEYFFLSADENGFIHGEWIKQNRLDYLKNNQENFDDENA